jgi:hypothetical protein
MSKVLPTTAGFSGNARNILLQLEHLMNNGDWKAYNRKLDSLAKKYGDDPYVAELIKQLKVKNSKDFKERRDHGLQ